MQKFVAVAVTVVCAFTGCASIVTHEPIEQVRVSLYPVDTSFAQNDPIQLELRLWNDADRQQKIIATLDWRSSSVLLSILGPNGSVVKRGGREPDDFPTNIITIPPHSFVSSTWILRDSLASIPSFTFPGPGLYTARATVTICRSSDGLCRFATSDYVKIRIRRI